MTHKHSLKWTRGKGQKNFYPCAVWRSPYCVGERHCFLIKARPNEGRHPYPQETQVNWFLTAFWNPCLTTLSNLRVTWMFFASQVSVSYDADMCLSYWHMPPWMPNLSFMAYSDTNFRWCLALPMVFFFGPVIKSKTVLSAMMNLHHDHWRPQIWIRKAVQVVQSFHNLTHQIHFLCMMSLDLEDFSQTRDKEATCIQENDAENDHNVYVKDLILNHHRYSLMFTGLARVPNYIAPEHK